MCLFPSCLCPRDADRLEPRGHAHNRVGQIARLSIVLTPDGQPGVHLHRLHADHPADQPMIFGRMTPGGLVFEGSLGSVGVDPEGVPAWAYDVSRLTPGTLFVAGGIAAAGRIYHGQVLAPERAGDQRVVGGDATHFYCRRLDPRTYRTLARRLLAPGSPATVEMPRRSALAGAGAMGGLPVAVPGLPPLSGYSVEALLAEMVLRMLSGRSR